VPPGKNQFAAKIYNNNNKIIFLSLPNNFILDIV
jgi:hypothetical protein